MLLLPADPFSRVQKAWIHCLSQFPCAQLRLVKLSRFLIVLAVEKHEQVMTLLAVFQNFAAGRVKIADQNWRMICC